jgi:tight adherence protein B
MTPMLATLLAAAAVAVWLPSGASLLKRRGLTRSTPPVRANRMAALALLIVGVCLVVMVRRPRWLLTAAGMTVVAILSARLWRAQRSRRQAGQRRRRIMELCDSLAAELRAGLPPVVALEHAVDVMPLVAPAATAARLGGDVPGVLRQLAQAPGTEALRSVAAGWEIAQRTGGALAAVLDRVVAGIRDDESARREVEASLGPPRATARLLAVLPVGGVGLGTWMGAGPIHVLLGTTIGLVCLALGTSLALIGLLWVERLAAAVG